MKTKIMFVIVVLVGLVLLLLTTFIILHLYFAKNSLKDVSTHRITPTLSKEFSKSYVSTANYTKSISLSLLQKIPLKNVNGRIDHMDIDIKKHRLFIAELENNSIDILDLKNGGKRLQTITNNIREPQGLVYIQEYNKLFVSNGGDGKVNVFNATSYKLIDSINFSNDADNIRYDNISKLIYVGYGDGGIGIINATNDQIIKEIKLPAHPESFQIEKKDTSSKLIVNSTGKRIFVNTPDDNSISIIDLGSGIVSSKWSLEDSIHQNFPMALDQSNNRLFVGTRDPPKIIVFDTTFMGSGKGKIISQMNISADPDDIFYDSLNKIMYISCGEGFMDIFKQQDPNHYKLYNKIPTEAGARTSLFVPELERIFVAVPHYNKEDSEAEILVYGIKL